MNKTITRTPIFWIIFVTLSSLAGYAAYHYFPYAFTLLNVDLKMDRDVALQKATELATKYNWGPEGYNQAASFSSEREAKSYIELEGGGVETLRGIIKEGYYSPYQWVVRHFKHLDAHETDIYFTPEGRPYSFVETLDEKTPGAALTTTQAREIALKHAHDDWHVNFDEYELVEESQVTKPSGRIDHMFVYEKKNVKIGKGLYRLKLVVSGDKFTELTLDFKVPEGFTRRYEHMRSANNAIARGSHVILVVLYVLGGIILGLWLLLKQHYVLWHRPLFWATILALLHAANQINYWPLLWMTYDTAVSPTGFIFKFLMQLLVSFFMYVSAFTIIFAAAESLSRKAFGYHPQLWRLWSSHAAPTIQTVGRTIGGFLMPSFKLAYVVGFYFLTSRYLHWWSPAEALMDPNSLATYMPWFSAVSDALTAGFWEECMFRAIPLSCAALLGKKFGKRNLFIGIAMIIQALVFGAAHANYPAQPAYARVVELFLSSLIFGFMFLYFGLLPAILSHFAYDAILMALPIFISTGPGMWINQVMVIVMTLIPLFIVLYYRFLAGRWHELPQQLYNASWQAPARAPKPVHERPSLKMVYLAQRLQQIILVASIGGLCFWGLFNNFEQDSKPLTLSRIQALERASEYLKNKGIDLGDTWTQIASLQTVPDTSHTFIWREGGKELYQQLNGTYLMPAAWIIRYAQFVGDLEERAEEYHLYITNNGTVFRMEHILPEKRQGPQLSESDARNIAHKIIRSEYQLEPEALQEMSAESKQHPSRKDWKFIYKNNAVSVPDNGQARIIVLISGDTVTDHYRSVFVPETWERTYREKQTLFNNISLVSLMLLALLMMIGFYLGISHHQGIAWKVSAAFAGILLLKSLLQIINLWPTLSASFSTSQPYTTQALMILATLLMQILVISGFLGCLAGFLQQWHFSLHTKYHRAQQILFASSCVLLISGLNALIKRFMPSGKPLWADYSSLAAWSPMINSASSSLTTFIQTSLVVLLIVCIIDGITKGWHRHKNYVLIGFIALGILLAGINITKTESIIGWLVSGSLQGILLGLLYIFIIRFDRSTIVLLCAGLSIFLVIENGILMANKAAVPGIALACIIIGLFSWWWSRLLREE